jgi:2-hydroxychromene-2-carboxylate isomerase
MADTIELFLDIGSPTAYLAFTQVPGLVQRSGKPVVLRPFLLGGVFKATGNSPPIAVPAKGRNLMRDIERYAEHYGVPFRVNPHFPINTVTVMRGAAACAPGEELQRYLVALYQATWVDGLNVGDEAVLRQVLAGAGFDADAWLARTQSPDVKQALIASTEEAVKRGAYGAPSWFVGDELFFGHDRLAMVEKYARRA